MRQATEIIDLIVEAGIYNFWISQLMEKYKVIYRKIAIFHPLDGYYSFNLYHMQPAFYFLLMHLCLSALCFIFELLYSRVLSKRKLSSYFVGCYVFFKYFGCSTALHLRQFANESTCQMPTSKLGISINFKEGNIGQSNSSTFEILEMKRRNLFPFHNVFTSFVFILGKFNFVIVR
jgi:hypothetical protein